MRDEDAPTRRRLGALYRHVLLDEAQDLNRLQGRLVDLLRDGYADRRLLDTQWQTDHLATLGVVEVDRRVYLKRLERALALPLPAAFAG